MVRKTQQWTRDEIIAAEDALIDFQFSVFKVMKDRSLSNKDLAKLLGLSPARVSQLLSPEANPSIKLVGRILNVLGFERPLKHLLSGTQKSDSNINVDFKKWDDGVLFNKPVVVWKSSVSKHHNDNMGALRNVA